MKFYPFNTLYKFVFSLSILLSFFSCDISKSTNSNSNNPTDTISLEKVKMENLPPSKKEIITYDEVLKLYTCLNKDNFIGNGENKFILKHKGKIFELFWGKIIDTENYELFLVKSDIKPKRQFNNSVKNMMDVDVDTSENGMREEWKIKENEWEQLLDDFNLRTIKRYDIETIRKEEDVIIKGFYKFSCRYVDDY
jgi:hypothetical protein